MKIIKYILPATLLLFLALNMNSADRKGTNAPSLNTGFMDASILVNDTMSREEFSAYMEKEVLSPLREKLKEERPHLFMTKCYSDLFYVLDHELTKNRMRREIYKSYAMSGMILLDECGASDFICQFQVTVEKNEVTCKASFTEEYIPLTKFIKKVNMKQSSVD